MENKYKIARIYKIISPSHPELVYYGSTTKILKNRFSQHKNKSNNCTSKQIIDLGDAEIVLVDIFYNCVNKKELHKIEGEYIKNNNCINLLYNGSNGF